MHSKLLAPAAGATPDPSQAAEALRCHDLQVGYRRHVVIRNVSFLLRAGQVIGLIGDNGSGKTTLLRTLAGQRPARSGTIQDPRKTAPWKGNRDVGSAVFVPSEPAADPFFSAEWQVANHAVQLGVPRDQAMARAERVLTHMGLGDVRDARPDTFSTGMRKRLQLATALVCRPRILFLDEPFAGLDLEGRQVVRRVIRAFAATGGATLVSLHYRDDLVGLVDGALALRDGRAHRISAAQAARALATRREPA